MVNSTSTSQLCLKPTARDSLLPDFHYYAETAHWYALYTHSRAEKKVRSALEIKIEKKMLSDIKLYLPLYTVRSKWSDRIKDVEKPLFPSYLFIKTRLTNYHWREIILTPGVANLLHQHSKPVVIPAHDIAFICQMLQSQQELSPYIHLREGQRVLVRKGPFAGIEGILQRIQPNSHKLVVNFPLLNRSVRTTIDFSDVEPI